jgi:integral membrane protein (TIGR01906 family)
MSASEERSRRVPFDYAAKHAAPLREKEYFMNNTLSSILSWLTALLTPILLLGLGLRILLTPLFYNVEYRMPYFPPDPYGFTTQDRLHWASYAVNYLINNAGISYLGDLTFPNGTPLYNERELSHMHDVKVVTQGALKAWYVSIVLLIGLGIWARYGKWWQAYLQGLRRGGWLMIGLVVVIGLFGAVAFWQFFTLFHELFFKGNSWLFENSDTLIRLFPLQFWQDAFLWAGIIAVGGALGLSLGIKVRPIRGTTD